MKILRIELENFASHVHGDIDLSKVVSATISGKNGSGKSTAFVDAPLWCLFGKCRSEADLMVRHDEQRMSVTVDFSLDGNLYRVKRTRSRQTKAGKTELSFFAFSEDAPVPIGGHSVKETQEAIKNVLNADYELCANSNFLIQGKADKFSTAGPAERKAILAQVLKLDEYAILKHMAGRKVMQTDDKIKTLQHQKNPLEIKVDNILNLKDGIRTAEQDLQVCSAGQINVGTELKHFHETKGVKQTALNEIIEGKVGLDALLKERDELDIKIDRNKADQTYYQDLINKKEVIELQAIEYEQRSQELSIHKDTEVQLMKSIIDVENEIRNALESKSREAETLQRVKAELVSLEHKKELIQSQKEVELGKKSNEIGQDIQQGKLLEMVPCWEELQKKCQFTIEAVQAMKGLQDKKYQLGILEQRNFLREQLPDYEKDHATRLEQINNLQNTKTEKQLEELREQRQTITLNKGVSTKALEKIQERMKVLEPLAKRKAELDSVLKEVEKLTALLKAHEERQHQIHNDIQKKMLKADEESELSKWLNEAEANEGRLIAKQSFYNGEVLGTTERLGRLRQECEQAEVAQVQLKELQQELTTTTDQHYTFKTLANYYTTIPIMIMEGAVPTLETATNSILEKISPSGMRIRLETQKALKSSDKIGETLDILVRDVFGEKPYENYSGGEKFRLDLALRFGLSQLLMHRAGSRMETLIVDEGLGSLDEDGLSLLRECLSKLETSFGLILIISHVEGIQGTFEQEILVEKTNAGSEIKIL